MRELNVKAASPQASRRAPLRRQPAEAAVRPRADARPRVLLLDEPTKGVDASTRAEIYRLVVELADRASRCPRRLRARGADRPLRPLPRHLRRPPRRRVPPRRGRREPRPARRLRRPGREPTPKPCGPPVTSLRPPRPRHRRRHRHRPRDRTLTHAEGAARFRGRPRRAEGRARPTNASGPVLAFGEADLTDERRRPRRRRRAPSSGSAGSTRWSTAPASITPASAAEDVADADWDRTIAVNLTAMFRVCRAALPLLRAAGGGSIVNIASVHAEATVPGVPAYAASKAGVVGLTRQLALDYAVDRIRVNALIVGSVATRMTLDGLEPPAAPRRSASPSRRTASPASPTLGDRRRHRISAVRRRLLRYRQRDAGRRRPAGAPPLTGYSTGIRVAHA